MVAVVLAGGESRRFGSDKLVADLDGRTVLDRALDGLPAGAVTIVVGPERQLSRAVEFVREDPPGGGPAAGLIAGLLRALQEQPELIITLPGDAPSGGRAAMLLATHLQTEEAESVVGLDASSRDQVLQLALRPRAAHQLVGLAGADGGQGQSVRRLVTALDPPPLRLVLPDRLAHDVDTTADLEQLRNLNGA